jgi:very-short-patch-repair endonuclease
MTEMRNVPGRPPPPGSGNEMHGDRALVAIAARQHGVVSVADVAAAGIGRGGLAHRVANGRLRRLHRGVFLVGPLQALRTSEMAAVLAVGGVLSHRSAASVLGIGAPPAEVDVTLTRNARRRDGVRVHRTARLGPGDVWWRDGLPITSPARTLIDLAAVLTRVELARAVEEAQVRRLVTVAGLAARLADERGPAAAILRAELHRGHEPSLTRSEAEAAFLRLVREARLPHPETNVRIAGYEVDFLWRAQRLVVEVDGYAYHGTREAFERDRRKDAALQAHGLRTTRATYRQITEAPLALTASLAASLRARF